MIPGFPLLMLIVLSLGLMLGVTKPRRIGTFLLWLIVGPVLIGFAIHTGKQIFSSLSPSGQLLGVLLAILVLGAIVIRFMLPRGVTEALLAALIYDFLKWAVMLPFFILGSMARLIVRTVGPRLR